MVDVQTELWPPNNSVGLSHRLYQEVLWRDAFEYFGDYSADRRRSEEQLAYSF